MVAQDCWRWGITYRVPAIPMVGEAEVHGRKTYQLRVGGLSKADAAALCGRLKASGEPGCSLARE
jgi:hypothetical protein